jgi:hypothetical protein
VAPPGRRLRGAEESGIDACLGLECLHRVAQGGGDEQGKGVAAHAVAVPVGIDGA